MSSRITIDAKLWRSGRMPFVIDTVAFPAGSPNFTIVNTAITNWNNAVPWLRLTPKDGEVNFVRFTSANGSCSSPVGMQGGVQDIRCDVGNGFNASSVMHETAHAAGFWHEQSRQDRDSFVGIRLENVTEGNAHNFNKEASGLDLGRYDYASLMHYGANAFSNGGGPTIIVPAGTAIGGANTLSAGDLAGLQLTYQNRSGWTLISGGLQHVSVGANNVVWGVNSSNEIFRQDNDVWTKISGGLKQISVGADGTVWGVNSSDQIFRRDGSAWTLISGGLKYVSVGNANNIWGVNSSNEIFRRDIATSSWVKISGGLKQVSVASDGTVWGVNSSNEIFRRDGAAWTQIAGGLSHISVGNANTIWGVNSSNEIYRRNILAANWVKVDGGLKQISVAADGSIWGVNASNQIFRR